MAQRSAGAAKEIKALIGYSVEKVDIGSKLVDQAGATMTDVVESVRRVNDIISEIAAASQEQTAGIEQINRAIMEMDNVTQQNASLVEDAAAAAESMQDQAGSLTQVVSVFNLETAVGRVRVCCFPALWLDATRRQTAFCNEVQRRQKAGKLCNRTCSVLTIKVNGLTSTIVNKFRYLLIEESGQLPFLGSNLTEYKQRSKHLPNLQTALH